MCENTYVNIQTGEVLDIENISSLKENSMLKHSPHLFEEWGFEKNNSLNIYDVTKGSRKKVWWICLKCKSSYCTIIVDKVKENGCGYCSGKKVNHTNSLQSINPLLASQWHPTLNKDLTPNDVTCQSNKKVWWICEKCRSNYNMAVYSRTNNRNCPYCRGLKTNNTNSLASLNPELTKQWHPKKNGELTPHDVTCGSDKKVWWKCELGHEWEATISNRTAGKSCPMCYGTNKTYLGINDMWTTNPELASKLLNKDDGYRYTQSSNVKVDWKCTECHRLIKDKSINYINRVGLSCPSCSDNGKSYPEKIIYYILNQLEVEFEWEKTFKWSNGKRYDFYIPLYSMIIEVHGLQHYERGFENLGGRSLEEEQENDQLKELLAKNNGIEHYINIDARESVFNYIKNNVINNKIANIFEIEKIDWDNVGTASAKSLIVEVCEFYKNNDVSLIEISREFKLSTDTVREYLKQGQSVGLCDYTPNNDKIKNLLGKHKHIPVVQLSIDGDFLDRYESITQIREKYNRANVSSISACCKGKLKTSLGFRRMYANDYDNYMAKNMKIPHLIETVRRSSKVVRLSVNDEIKVYLSISEATSDNGGKSKGSINSISACCKGKQRTAIGFRWMYLEDYEKQYGKIDE